MRDGGATKTNGPGRHPPGGPPGPPGAGASPPALGGLGVRRVRYGCGPVVGPPLSGRGSWAAADGVRPLPARGAAGSGLAAPFFGAPAATESRPQRGEGGASRGREEVKNVAHYRKLRHHQVLGWVRPALHGAGRLESRSALGMAPQGLCQWAGSFLLRPAQPAGPRGYPRGVGQPPGRDDPPTVPARSPRAGGPPLRGSLSRPRRGGARAAGRRRRCAEPGRRASGTRRRGRRPPLCACPPPAHPGSGR